MYVKVTADLRNSPRGRFTVKALLVPLLTHPKFAHFIKYAVYLLLTVNFFVYALDDYHVYGASLSADTPISDIFLTFATTIDTAAWLGLVFLFELETYALSDASFEGGAPIFIHALRIICYVAIAYAAYGYTAETLENYDVVVLDDISNVCQVADKGIWLQVNSIDFEEITAENCSTLSDSSRFYRVAEDLSIVDEKTLPHIQWVGWVDVVNAYVWLIVVFLIEMEVWLQAQDRFFSRALPVVRTTSTFCYGILILNAIIWAFAGYDLYTWDSFLWIFGFWAIELNLAEWERDRTQQLQEELA